MNRNTLNRSAALALIGACAPLASADPWLRFQFGNDHSRREQVHIRGPVVCREPQRPVFVPVRIQRVEVLPCDLQFSAYQSRDTVIIIASGTNRSAGFATSFGAIESGSWAPALTLCNLSPDSECAAQVVTPFSISASFHAHSALRCISVRIAGQCIEVPVTQTRCLS